MAVVKRDANIFKVLKTIHDAWASIENYDTSCFCDEEIESWRAAQRRFVFDGADVRQSFLTEFEEFLFSCKWTDSDVAKEIVGYIQNGTPLNQIGDIVGLKNSAFRMRISRMTDTINGLLFDGQPCPEGVYSLTDLAALKKCLVKLRLVRDPVNINEEFSLRQLGWLKSHIGQADSFDVGRENFDKYLQDWVLDMVSNILIEVMASVAEEERFKIHRRQEEGIAVAKAKGVVFGRPSIAKPANYEAVMALVDSGQIKAVEAMRELGVKKTTFYKLRQAYWQAVE